MYAAETHNNDAETLSAGRVVRIDLATKRVAARYDVFSATFTLAGDSLWVGVDQQTGRRGIKRVVRLDRETLARQGEVTLPGVPRTDDLVSVAGAMWTLSGQNAIRIDPVTARITAIVPLVVPTSAPLRSLAVSNDGSHLYVGWSERQQYGVTEYDATSGRVLNENAQVGGGPVDAGPALTYSGSRLWATFRTGSLAAAVALRSTDLSIRTDEGVGPSGAVTIAPGGDVLWAYRGNRVDCVTIHNKTLASYALPVDGGGLAAMTRAAAYIETSDGITITKPNRLCL